MKRIKIGQLGIGHNHGEAKMAALRKLPDLFEVVGVVESDPEWYRKRSSLNAYKGLPFMTEEELFAVPGLEAVAVETDGFDLVTTAIRAAKRGLHIHLDKPAGQSLGDFRQLIDICQKDKLALQLAYIYRYNPAIKFCLDIVRKGWLGDIFEIHAVMSRYDGDNPDYRRWLAQFKGGAMYIFAGYLIDLVISMLGKPDKVTPFMRQTRNDGLIDNGLAVLEYPVATATVRVSVEEIDGMKHRRLIVCGTKGTFELCPIEPPGNEYYTRHLTPRLTLKYDTEDYKAGTHVVDCGTMNDRYAGQLEEFFHIVRGDIVNPYPFEHEYLLHETLLAACGFPGLGLP